MNVHPGLSTPDGSDGAGKGAEGKRHERSSRERSGFGKGVRGQCGSRRGPARRLDNSPRGRYSPLGIISLISLRSSVGDLRFFILGMYQNVSVADTGKRPLSPFPLPPGDVFGLHFCISLAFRCCRAAEFGQEDEGRSYSRHLQAWPIKPPASCSKFFPSFARWPHAGELVASSTIPWNSPR